MNLNRYIISLFISFIFFQACGKNTKNEETKVLSEAQMLLDSKEYENAINLLEAESESHPENRTIKIKLAHSYAGAGGFEAILMVQIIKDLEKMEWKDELQDFFQTLEEGLQKLPSLNSHQKKRLSQAIQMYQSLELSPFHTTKENNFKWGILHTYRFLCNLKTSLPTLKQLSENTSRLSEKETQIFLLSTLDVFLEDLYKTYLYFKNSYEKAKTIFVKMEDAVKKKFEEKNFTLMIESKANDYQEFALDLVRENEDIFAKLMAKLEGHVEFQNTKKLLHVVTERSKQKDELPENQREVLEQLEKFMKEFIHYVILKNPVDREDLKTVFNKDFIEKFHETMKNTIKEKTFFSLSSLLESDDLSIVTLRNMIDKIKKEVSNLSDTL